MQTTPTIDLERPYIDAAAREERYQDIESTEAENIWYELQDELYAEKFIQDFDDVAAFAEVIKDMAIAQEKISKLKAGKLSLGDTAIEILKAKESAYQTIYYRIDDMVQKMAARNAQSIYDRS